MHRSASYVALLLLLFIAVSPTHVATVEAMRAFPAATARGGKKNTVSTPGVANCTLKWQRQFLDNFGWRNETYLQRYFLYDKWYKPGGALFIYVGNEGNVELYTNTCGLMWEHAEEFNALVVFAEHRFFGQSLPCKGGFRECGDYLGAEQAMADYANLISQLHKEYSGLAATFTFGGSYGGMLAAWMRMRYPALVTGAIASSAPIACLSPQYKGESYWAVVTGDASTPGGAAPNCSANVHQALMDIFNFMQTAAGRQELAGLMRLCSPLGPGDTEALALFVQGAFDALAMGDYPFPTYYISGSPEFPTPAWPMRVACESLATAAPTPQGRISNLLAAMGVVNNVTKDVQCYNISGLNPSVYSPAWDFMVCTDALINEQPYFAATGPPNDMFWPQPVYTRQRLNEHCTKAFGKTPRYDALNNALGIDAIPASSNIVFANGLRDPWHSGGILSNISDTLVALIIPEGAHHLDLFFSTPYDPPSVIEVRRQEIAYLRTWMRKGVK